MRFSKGKTLTSKNRCDLKDITKPNDTVSRNAIRSLFRGHTIVNVLFPQVHGNVWPPVRYANIQRIYTPHLKKTSVHINLKYHTVVHECFRNVKIRERFSMSNKFPSCSFLLSYLNDNVFAVRPAYIFG